MPTRDELEVLGQGFYQGLDDRIAEAQARFSPPVGHCQYCESAYDNENGGWYSLRIYLDDAPELRDVLQPGDIFVISWGGWYRACEHCNDPEWDDFRLPTVHFTSYEKVIL